VALTYAYLWSDMDLRRCSPKWADVLWQRSKNALVTLWVDSNISQAELEDKHIPRLEGLHVSIFPGSAYGTWDKIVAHTDVISTQMKTLDFKCIRGINDRSVVLEVPKTLPTGNQQPSLTTLILRLCITNLRSPLFSNLTLLSVQKIGPRYLHVSAWLEILEAMPKLVKLDLGDAIVSPDKRRHFEPLKMVQLQCLQSLSIWDVDSHGSDLFVHLIPPISCSLDISFRFLHQNSAVVDHAVIKKIFRKIRSRY